MKASSPFFSSPVIWISSLLLFLAPGLSFVIPHGTGYCFFILLVFALGSAITSRPISNYFAALWTYRWYTLGSLAILLGILVQQGIGGNWSLREVDQISRFALALLLFLFFRQLPSKNLWMLTWGCTAGAIFIGFWALFTLHAANWIPEQRLTLLHMNPIPFGNMVLLLSVLSLSTLRWGSPFSMSCVGKALRLAAFFAGNCVFFLSGTRGGWVALFVIFALLGFQYRCWFGKNISLLIATALLLGASLFLCKAPIAQRLADTKQEVALIKQGQRGTSLGQRLEMWEIAWHLFKTHPWYGVGKGQLKHRIPYADAHNDFLTMITEMGAVGLVSLLLFYFGMTVYFWCHRGSADSLIRNTAYTGLILASSIILFGLFDTMLLTMKLSAPLAMLCAVFLAMIDVRKHEIAVGSAYLNLRPNPN